MVFGVSSIRLGASDTKFDKFLGIVFFFADCGGSGGVDAMAGGRRRGANKAKAKGQLSLGDLVLAKVKGFPFWPAKVCLL